MGFEQASIASVVPKDCGRKKRGNRSAKLKQCKLDARRQQWLSQGAVKNTGVKEDKIRMGTLTDNERDCSMENLEMRSLSNSPNSPLNGGVLGGNALRSIFCGSSSSSGGSCSGSISEEDEEVDGGCLDDWEAVADALAANDNLHKPEFPSRDENTAHSESKCELTLISDSAAEIAKSDLPRVNSHAWRPDDVFRPQCLPNLSKQWSMPNPERQCGYRGVQGAYKSVKSAPSLCPICCDDFDITDAKFLPCLCGFHLCLFCHKRILEEDGRCPGCRKSYEQQPVEVHRGITLTRSCSMITRS